MAELYILGRRIGYECNPTDFDVTKTVILFVHGTGGDRHDWRSQLDHISVPGSVIAVELPGHGVSDPPGETTISAYAEWVEGFVEILGLKRVIIVGCSLGSAIAQWIAFGDKPWLFGVGLIGSGARLRVHPFILEGLVKEPSKTLQTLADYCLSNSSPNLLRNTIREKYAKADPITIHGDLTACDKFDVMNRLQEIYIPTLVVVGEEDVLTPVKYSKYLSEKIKTSNLVTIPGAGHLVMMEKPAEFNLAIQRFVDNLEKSAE